MARLWAGRRKPVAGHLFPAATGHWQAALAFTLAAGLITGFELWRHEDAGSIVEEQAEILRLDGFDSVTGHVGGSVVLSVRLRDGAVRQLTTWHGIVRRCQVGSTVRVLRGSRTMRVSPMECAPVTA